MTKKTELTEKQIKDLAPELARQYKVRVGKKDSFMGTDGELIYENALQRVDPRAIAMMNDPTKKEEGRIIENAIQKRFQEQFGVKTKDGKIVLDPVKLKDPNRVKIFGNLLQTDLGERNFEAFLSKNLVKSRTSNHFKFVMEAEGIRVDDKAKEKFAVLAETMTKKFIPKFVDKNFKQVEFGIKQALKDVKPNSKISDKDLDKLLKKAEANITRSLEDQQTLERRGLKRPDINTSAKISPKEIEANKAKKAKAEQEFTNQWKELAAKVSINFTSAGKNFDIDKLNVLSHDLTKKLGTDYVKAKDNKDKIVESITQEIMKKQGFFSRKMLNIPEKDIVSKVYAQHQKAAAVMAEKAALSRAKPNPLKEVYIAPKQLDPFPQTAPWTAATPPPLLSARKASSSLTLPEVNPDVSGLDYKHIPENIPKKATITSYKIPYDERPKTADEATMKLKNDIGSHLTYSITNKEQTKWTKDYQPKTIAPTAQKKLEIIAQNAVKTLGADYVHARAGLIAEDIAKKIEKKVGKRGNTEYIPDSIVKDIQKDINAKHGTKSKEYLKNLQQQAQEKSKEAFLSLTAEKRKEINARIIARHDAEKIGSTINKPTTSKSAKTPTTKTPPSTPVKRKGSKGGIHIS